MNTEEKAKELRDKFKPHADWNNDYGSSEKQANLKHAKNCALICVEEIIKEYDDKILTISLSDLETCNHYWEEVKEELYKL